MQLGLVCGVEYIYRIVVVVIDYSDVGGKKHEIYTFVCLQYVHVQ